MDAQRRTFATFLALNARRAAPTEEPTVYMMFSADDLQHGSLVALKRDDVLAECRAGRLDVESELVRWMLNQMNTYRCTQQRILALRFDRSTVLSEVLRCP